MRLFLQVTVALVVGVALSYFGLLWLSRGADTVAIEQLSPVEQALRLTESRGCNACHSVDGSRGIGPSWRGGWGQTRRFKDGGTAVVDAAYLRESMLNPGARVVEGYDDVMLPAAFTEEEMDLVILLIRELSTSVAE